MCTVMTITAIPDPTISGFPMEEGGAVTGITDMARRTGIVRTVTGRIEAMADIGGLAADKDALQQRGEG